MLEYAQHALFGGIVFLSLALFIEVFVVTSHAKKASVGDNGDTSTARASKLSWYGTAFIIVGFVLLTVYLVWRSILTGHPPFANQHEYSVSFAWGLVLVYLLFLFFYKIRAIVLLVVPTALILLLYATQLEQTIRPLVPALHNSLLLTFHVGFAILSYGAAGVSFAAAVLYLIKPRLQWRVIPRQEVLDDIGYRAAALAFPLMTIMIILGALWANKAWGRYWGWDPKETSAFVVWLLYGAYLHARVVAKWKGTRSAWLLIVAFAAIIFTLLGNHFFGGLHSYA